MIVEEKKAGANWCPHVRHPGEDGGTFNRGYEEGNEINAGREVGNWSCACVGSRCMAWRWEVLTKIEKEGDDGLEYLVTVRSDVHGYCGLAGRP